MWVKPNKYRATCCSCVRGVRAGEGFTFRGPRRFHVVCARTACLVETGVRVTLSSRDLRVAFQNGRVRT